MCARKLGRTREAVKMMREVKLFLLSNKNIKVSSFKSSGYIQMLDGGPDRSVSNNQFSSVTLNERETKARERKLQFQIQQGIQID